MAKITEWNQNELRPTCAILDSIGEAGDLKAESLRLLKQHEICTDSYEAEDDALKQDTPLEDISVGPIFDCLKPFLRDLNKETGEWMIPKEEI